MKKQIKIMVADDHWLIRQVVQLMVNADGQLQLAGQAGSARELLEQIEKDCPDVVIMDVELPDIKGTVATKMIKDKYPQIEVIAFSDYDEPQYIQEMKDAGAKAYVTKERGHDELVKAILKASKGECYYPLLFNI
jgi:DNA-binding NarL/FixJ family response regulator